eukprot:565884_1
MQSTLMAQQKQCFYCKQTFQSSHFHTHLKQCPQRQKRTTQVLWNKRDNNDSKQKTEHSVHNGNAKKRKLSPVSPAFRPAKKPRVVQTTIQSCFNKKLIKDNKMLKTKIANINECNKCKKLQKEIEQLKNGDVRYDTLNYEALDAMELRLQSQITKIKKAKERLLENKLYCIACLEKQKNIVIEGCNHLDLCHQCEQKLQPKICPRCQVPFTNVIKLKI